MPAMPRTKRRVAKPNQNRRALIEGGMLGTFDVAVLLEADLLIGEALSLIFVSEGRQAITKRARAGTARKRTMLIIMPWSEEELLIRPVYLWQLLCCGSGDEGFILADNNNRGWEALLNWILLKQFGSPLINCVIVYAGK